MRNTTLATLALVAVAALSLGVRGQQADKKDGKGPFKLGVVNLKSCFEKERYSRVKDIDAELEKKREEYERKIQEVRQRITQLEEQINTLPRDNPLRAEKILHLGRARSDLDFEDKFGRNQFIRFYTDRKTEVYNDIRKAISGISQEQHFDLVLRVESPLLEDQDPESLSQRINNRLVLYYHESVDITESVIKKLNDDYAKMKALPPAAEWECPVCKKKNKAAEATCTATKDCKGKKP